MRIFQFICIFLFVGSCTSLTKEQCSTMDWKAKGKTDAYAGLTVNQLAEHEKQCAKHSISTNREDYKRGHELGLRSFCTVSRGESFGKDGGTYRGQCPKEWETEFLKSYNLGYREYKLEKREKELEEKEAALRESVTAAAQFNGKKCTFDSDCTVELSCSLNRCDGTGRSCTFDSDCEVEGSCSLNRCEY